MEVNLFFGSTPVTGQIKVSEVIFEYEEKNGKDKNKQIPLIIDPANPNGDWKLDPATDAQKGFLERRGIFFIPTIKKGEAAGLITKYIKEHSWMFPPKEKTPPVVKIEKPENKEDHKTMSDIHEIYKDKSNQEIDDGAKQSLYPWESEELEADAKLVPGSVKIKYSHGGKRPGAGRKRKEKYG